MLTTRRLALSTVLLLLASSVTFAQERQREQLSTSGTLRAVARGGLQLATEGNELWNVKLPARAENISFTAAADTTFLKPGMLVKFSAIITKKGQVAEPVKSLVIFTPAERTELGVYPENTGEGASPLDGLFSSEPKEQPKKATKKIVEDQPYRIGGTLVSLKSGKMVVAAGGLQIKCDLADDAKVRVAVSDLSWAKLGDKVEVDGWYYAGMKQAGVVGTKVSVTAVNPLVGEKKRSRTKSDDDKPAEEKPAAEKPSVKEAAPDK